MAENAGGSARRSKRKATTQPEEEFADDAKLPFRDGRRTTVTGSVMEPEKEAAMADAKHKANGNDEGDEMEL